jgi:hypothetical protein
MTAKPKPGEFDEFDLGRYRVGECYLVSSQLASLLILTGCAELVDEPARTEAAGVGRSRLPKKG